MPETDLHQVNVEEIMEKIRSEVAKRRDECIPVSTNKIPSQRDSRFIAPRLRGGKSYLLAGKTGRWFRRLGIYGILRNVNKLISNGFKNRIYFTPDEFTKCHDEEFITKAYQGLLQREPDAHGFHFFLSRLRRGELTKIEILGRLRYSKEGRENKIRIKGLFIPFAIHTSYKIPLAGYVLRWVSACVRVPIILRNLYEFEAFTNERFTGMAANLEAISSDQCRMKQLQDSMKSRIDAQVASHRAAGELLHDLRDKVDSKIDMGVLSELRREISTKADMQVLNGVQSELDGIFKKLSDHKVNILDQQNRLSLLAGEPGKWLSKRLSELEEEDHSFDSMYVAFENEFRGQREEIKEKQRLYLTYIEEAGLEKEDSLLLDLGCGRGEWLELLKENGYAGRGVDFNRVMIQQCKDLGFDVAESEMVEFLKDQKQHSYAGVTGFHIVEHLPLRTLVTVLDEVLRVLKPGGVVIFETPNPENLIVSACNFYFDPTHRNPIPPPLLKFLLESRGFVKTKIIKLHPYKFFKDGLETSEEVRALRSLVTMEQDYAVIAYKA